MARKLRITKRTPWYVVLVLLFITIGQYYGWFGGVQQADPHIKSAVVENQPGLYKVTKFHDGDTIEVNVNGANETIRFIGVDTPETHDPRKAVQCYGKTASAFTKQLIGSKSVRLEADPLNTNRDRYKRLLRYVYLPDGTLVNRELIKQGYGFAYLSFPFSKSDEFRNLQTEARQNNRGLWGSCQPTENQYGRYTSSDAP
jgi:endonuclease YncB( thermonuclease family)